MTERVRPHPAGESRQHEPPRFREASGDVDGLESRAALLAEAARAPQAPDPAALARIASAVNADAVRRPRRLLASQSLRPAWTFGGTVVVLGLIAAGGARALWSRHAQPALPAAPPQATPAHVQPRIGHRQPVQPPAPVPDDPTPISRPVAEPPSRSAPPAAHVERASPPAPPSEAAVLARALSELRQRKNPGSALALLDQHDRQFPRGALRTEALRTRAEALLASDDAGGALELLDAQAALAKRLGVDLLLARAELRAVRGRYGEALADFDAVLQEAGQDPPDGEERALYGRAVCLGHLGQDAQARADLQSYQRRFPAGRFAAEVDRLLAGAAARAGQP